MNCRYLIELLECFFGERYFQELLDKTIPERIFWEKYLRGLPDGNLRSMLLDLSVISLLLDVASQCYWGFFREILSRTIWENYLRELLGRRTWEDYFMETCEVCYCTCMSKHVYLSVTWCRSSLFELKKMCFHSWVEKRLLKNASVLVLSSQ